MSSLEEPFGLDKLPSMSTIDMIQRFSSGACRPRVDDMGMGNCFIEGRSCSSSNSCTEDYQEYSKEAFPWRRHTRDMSQGDFLSRRSLSLGRNTMVFGNVCDTRYVPDHQYNSNSNGHGIREMPNKYLKGIQNEKNNCDASCGV